MEEPSAEAALKILLPKIAPGVSFKIHPFQGKSDLLGKLENRLRGYRQADYSSAYDVFGICVLVDQDNDDCLRLKAQIDDAAGSAEIEVLSRIAIEELEAWFLGDPVAVRAAFPRVGRFENRKKFRDPDAVSGGTWEALAQLLQNKGYFHPRYPKITGAKQISSQMDCSRNRSRSFIAFRDGIRRIMDLD